jgi:hypothetical protein
MICDVPAHYLPKPFCDFMGDRFAECVQVLFSLRIDPTPCHCEERSDEAISW